jgi:hypothetical protein
MTFQLVAQCLQERNWAYEIIMLFVCICPPTNKITHMKHDVGSYVSTT